MPPPMGGRCGGASLPSLFRTWLYWRPDAKVSTTFVYHALPEKQIMSWAENFKFRLQVTSLMLAVGCPGFIVWMVSQARQQMASYSWPSVPGKVQATVAKPWFGENGRGEAKYFGRVVYQYSVSGQDYTSDLTDLGPGSKHSDEREALADVAQYQQGDPVTVFYDPADPQIAVIQKGVPPVHQYMYIALALLTVVSWIGSVFVIRSWFGKPAAEKSGETL